MEDLCWSQVVLAFTGMDMFVDAFILSLYTHSTHALEPQLKEYMTAIEDASDN